MLALVLERGLDVRAAPVGDALGDLRDGHVLVALRRMRLARRRLGGRGGGRRLGSGLRGGGRLVGGGLRSSAAGALADRVDLDLRQAGAETGVLLVAGAALVLADPDLVALDVADDGRGDRDAGAVAVGDEQQVGREALALVRLQAIDQQLLALLDAVLLATDFDDCVGHSAENAGTGPRAEAV